jgi:ABC-type xylose transport system permease subunit
MIFLARLISNRKVGKNAFLMSHLYIEIILLPRQARDKHRESTRKKRAFSYVLQENAIVAVLFSTFALLAGVRGVVCELLTAALMASIGTAATKRPFPFLFLLL